MKLLPLTLLTLLLSSCAGNPYVTLHGLSYHKDRTLPYNEVNLGAGVGYGTDSFFVEAGTYDNSYNLVSKYIWTGTNLDVYKGVRLGAIAGPVTGYAEEYTPVVAPYLQYKFVRVMFSDEVKTFSLVHSFK